MFLVLNMTGWDSQGCYDIRHGVGCVSGVYSQVWLGVNFVELISKVQAWGGVQ